MTARADISNARRKKFEERLSRTGDSRSAESYEQSLDWYAHRLGEANAHVDELEAKLRNCEERARVVVPSEEHVKALTAWEKGEALPPFYREVLEEGVRRGDVVPRKWLSTERQVNAELSAYLREAEIADREWVQHTQELGDKLREAEGRIKRAQEVLDREFGRHHVTTATAQYEAVRKALSILAGTEKEGGKADETRPR